MAWCADGMIVERHTESLQHLEPRECALDELCKVWHATRKMCACVRTVRCYLYIVLVVLVVGWLLFVGWLLVVGCGLWVVEWFFHSERTIIDKGTDLSEFFR